jgi:hypothetical protein
MTKLEIGSLVFRVAGIYVLVQAATSLFTTGMLFTMQFQHEIGLEKLNWRIIIPLGSAPTFVLTVLGIVLVRWSERFAQWTFARPDELATVQMTAADLQSALLTVIGVSIVAEGAHYRGEHARNDADAG